MSKYIKLEDAISVCEVKLKLVGDTAIGTRYPKPKENINALLTLPTIDIVHCGECKYFNEDKCWNLKGLNKTDGVVKADDFCSNGERRGNE